MQKIREQIEHGQFSCTWDNVVCGLCHVDVVIRVDNGITVSYTHLMLKYRRAHKLYLKGHYFLARWISQRAARKTGIEIHPGATIGKGLFIDHGSGVIIGETEMCIRDR